MKYKGYTVEQAERKLPNGIRIKGIGIFAGERLLSIAEDTTLAKRAIDTHSKAGIWPTLEEKNDEKRQDH